MNGTSFQRQGRSSGNGRSRGRGGKDYGRGFHQSHGESSNVHQKLDKFKKKRNDRQDKVHKPPKEYTDVCFRCGSKGHWACVCRTPKHLVELYRASTGHISQEKRGNQEQQKLAETNFMNINDDAHLDVFDFINDPYYNFEIGEGSESMGKLSGTIASPNV